MEAKKKYALSIIVRGVFIPSVLIVIVVFLTGGLFNNAFVKFGETLYYPLMGFVVSLLVLIILFLRTMQFTLRTKINLLLMAGFLVIFNLLNTIYWDVSSYNPPFKRPYGNPFLNYADGILLGVVITLFLHLNSMRRFDINVPFSIFFVGMITPALIVTVLEGFSVEENAYNQLKFVSGYFLPLVGIAGFGLALYGIWISYLVLSISTVEEIRKGAYGLSASFVFLSYALASQVLFVGDEISIIGFRLRILQLVLFVIGTSVLVLVYAKYPIFTYAVPFRLYELIIYSKSGVPIWTISFISDSEDKREGLKTGALAAIGELIRDLSGFEGRLSEVKVDDGVLLLHQQGDFAGCLISEGVSFQLSRVFHEFCTEVFNCLEKEGALKRGQIPDPRGTLYPLVEKYFPVRFEKFERI